MSLKQQIENAKASIETWPMWLREAMDPRKRIPWCPTCGGSHADEYCPKRAGHQTTGERNG